MVEICDSVIGKDVDWIMDRPSARMLISYHAFDLAFCEDYLQVPRQYVEDQDSVDYIIEILATFLNET